MYNVYADIRTVDVKDLKKETRTGANGTFEAVSILFRVASDRNYRISKVVNGQTVEDYPTDFVLCRANGAVAEIISANCSEKNAEGKIISRHLLLEGHLETFQSPRKVPVQTQINYNGQILNVSLETEIKVDGFIFIVERVKFLDKKPTQVRPVNGAVATNVSVTPVAPTTAQQNTPVATPVQQNGTITQGVENFAECMNSPIPEVSTNFNASEGCPFN